MKNKFLKIITSISGALFLTSFVTLTACSIFDFSPTSNSKNHGILENNTQITTNTSFLNNRSLSLKFVLPKDSRTKVNIFGSGWIFDFEKENNYIKTFYIATNIHVINLISATKGVAELYLGQYDITNPLDPRQKAIFQSSPSTGNRPFIYNKDKYGERKNEINNHNYGSFSILPVGLNNQINNYINNQEVANLINHRNNVDLTSANDFAIIKLNVNNAWSDIPALKNFDEEIGIGLGSLMSNNIFYSAGYPHLETSGSSRITGWKQYGNNAGELLNSFNSKNYRSDNPIVFGYNNVSSISSSTENNLAKNNSTIYDSYDFATRGFDLGSGASGSPVIDEHNNFVGIYWGGFKVQEGFSKSSSFYGNFSPIFVDNQNKSQDLLHKYLVYTSFNRNKTYLDQNFNTNIQIEKLNSNNAEYFINTIKAIVDNNPEINERVAEINKSNDPSTLNSFNKLYELFFDYIKKNKVVNINYYLNKLKYDDIYKIIVSRNVNKNIAFKISFVTKSNYNFDNSKITEFKTTFTFFSNF